MKRFFCSLPLALFVLIPSAPGSTSAQRALHTSSPHTLAAPASTSADDGTWTELPPPPRYWHSAIYDPVRDRMLVFGGAPTSNDVWTLSFSGVRRWTRLSPAGPMPAARYLHTAIYDPARDRMVICGGRANLTVFNDAWTLSLSDPPAWTLLAPAGETPPGFYEAAAIHDPVRDRMVVFDGLSGESWALSFGEPVAWTRLGTIGGPPPSTAFNSAVYDADGDRMIVHLKGASTPDSATWALSFGDPPTWTPLAATGDRPCYGCGTGAAYDPIRHRLVVSGTADWFIVESRPQAWSLPLTGPPSWTLLVPKTPESYRAARSWHSGIHDSARDRVVVFGGTVYTGVNNLGGYRLNDAWAIPLAGPYAWEPVDPTPPMRRGHVAIYDPQRDRLIAFGGLFNQALDDTWAMPFADGHWEQLAPAGPRPTPRNLAASVHDAARDRMIVLGGDPFYYGATPADDAWALSLSGTPAWTQLLPAGTTPLFHAAIYDGPRDRVVAFGAGASHNQTWALPLAGPPAWEPLATAGTPPASFPLFPDGNRAAAILDPPRDRMILFGAGAGFDETWTLTLSGTPTWSQIHPAGAVPAMRRGPSAVYDPFRDRMLVFGSSSTYSPSCWALSLSGSPAWTQLAPAGGSPGGHWGHTAVYDSRRDRMVIFAGFRGSPAGNGNTSHPRNDLWALQLAGIPTPVALTLVSVRAEPGHVRLIWYAGDAGAVPAELQRREAGGAWQGIASGTFESNGRIELQDLDAVPGRRFAYRLVIRHAEGETFSQETWVDVPAIPSLALAGVAPSAGELAAMVALPDGPARVEAFDLAGRRIAALDLRGPTAGTQRVTLATGGRLAPGLYLLRLTRADRALTARALILR